MIDKPMMIPADAEVKTKYFRKYLSSLIFMTATAESCGVGATLVVRQASSEEPSERGTKW
jgi:hypothetical protein